MRCTPCSCADAATLRAIVSSVVSKSSVPAHRVHEVVDDLDIGHRPVDRGAIGEVALDDVDRCRPRHVAQSLGPAHEHPHLVPGLDEPGHEPSADVAGRAGHEYAHESPSRMLPTWVQRRSLPRL